ncbi:MAG: DNA topoisomerase VI subunit B [Thermoprotei archaeon]|nr:MAG: DNA topoisomerase VI subunit B [Thermoprotei archaeon]
MTILDEILALEEYKGLSPAEFFYRNREIAGFSNPTRALYQTVRELVENSLDATEMFGILPDIYVEVEEINPKENVVSVRVRDNGIGVPPEEAPNVFGRVFYGSKYKLRQSRGIFGLGVKMAVLYAQMTTGKPCEIRTATPKSDYIYSFKILIDISKNKPIIVSKRKEKNTKRWHGTDVRLILEGNWSGSKNRIAEYIKRTAMIAPYANITFRGPGVELIFKRVTKKLPEPPETGKPHPKGVDIELLKQLISGFKNLKEDPPTLQEFLVTCFDSVGTITARRFLEWAGFDPNVRIDKLRIRDLEKLARRMKEYNEWRRPRATPLSPLGEDLLMKGVKEILKAEFVTAVTRKPASYGGHPFIVEVALAWGGEIKPMERPLLLRFANKIPLLYDEGADVSRKVVDNIDWNQYKVKMPAPLAVVTHICSTKVPFKGVGKEAIADVPEIEKEIENAIKEAARRLRRYLSKKEKEMEVKVKYVTITKYADEVARALAIITKRDKEIYLKAIERLVETRILKRGARIKARVRRR